MPAICLIAKTGNESGSPIRHWPLNMRILLAGGAGFIGSHIADALLTRGDEVVAIDNFATGRRENVAHLSGNNKFTLIEHDITLRWPTHQALSATFDAVLDYASPASPNDLRISRC